ncbi:hypothetical protein QSU92_07710 [Microbacterium sp. ET2]|uniref:DUF3644 domain-containing protein n=1 Tax=Microbacterium albipurpureum TaxID=3050384 RepID=UPI00259CDB6E|nr:DUF3644 domain-containing protein [Microbacterium sp. ET2 (Ac-2212)]WJL97042.1 hypothetical protein QSU92_07710 [Microbacterium sp. ET2 (Ac-2212)]
MRLRRQTVLFRDTAIESLTLSIELFNRPSPLARNHAVVMMLAHAFEMILKAVIYQRRGRVRDKGDELTHSFARCIAIGVDDLQVLSHDEKALLLAVKQDRDCATHDTIAMSEDLLWIHMRAGITVLRRLLRDEFDQELTEQLPGRVIPVSAAPPRDLGALIEQELASVKALLAPRTRKTPEARARLRPLLSLDGAATGREDPPTEQEVSRAESALRAGKDWHNVFPGLAELHISEPRPGTDAQEVVLRLGQDREAVPVRRARPDEAALTYRTSNPFREFGIKLSDFGAKLGLNRNQGLALIEHLNLKADDRSYFVERTATGNVAFQGLSARSLELARSAIAASDFDIDAITATYNDARRHARNRR